MFRLTAINHCLGKTYVAGLGGRGSSTTVCVQVSDCGRDLHVSSTLVETGTEQTESQIQTLFLSLSYSKFSPRLADQDR